MGLRLDGVVVRRADTSVVLDAEWLRIRPSLLGLLGGRSSYPWTVAGALCSGEVELRFDDDGVTRDVGAHWNDLDLARCLRRAGSTPTLRGRLGGTATLHSVLGSRRPTGSGTLTLRSAAWDRPIGPLDETVLHADSGAARWTLGPELLSPQELDLRGPDLEVVAGGDARLRDSFQESALRLRVALTPMPGMPRQLRRLLAGLPRQADGRYVFRLSGTLNVPHAEPE